MADAIVIDDLASPRLPSWFDEIEAQVGIGPDRLLAVDELVDQARSRAGLHDLGDDWFREPFETLVVSLESDGRLRPFGRFQTRELLVGLLVTRLRLAALLDRRPEILDLPVDAPVIVLGLPRTGTSHLHELLASDPGLRSLPYWESIEPIPEGDRSPPDRVANPRRDRAEEGLGLMNAAMPLFAAMHEMTADGPHEEIQLLAVDFSTMLFEASYQVPGYTAWYRTHDQTHAYRTLKVLLQVLQHLRPGGGRWLLKSPQHLEQLGPLLEVFPDARIVQTHRDPLAVTASLATMCAYSRRTNYATVDPVLVGRTWAGRIGDLLRASVRDRPLVPDTQVLDVRFDDFMADQWRVVEQVYRLAGSQLTDEVHQRIQACMDANPRGKHGRVAYPPGAIGLDVAEQRRALRFYQHRFDIPDADPS